VIEGDGLLSSAIGVDDIRSLFSSD
jgi:hypothetical protein